MTDQWRTAISADEVEPGESVAVTIDGTEIAIYRVGNEFYATANRCTHAGAPLADGYLDGTIIECPLHQGLFDVRSGAAVCSPALRAVRHYPVRLESGKVEICM